MIALQTPSADARQMLAVAKPWIAYWLGNAAVNTLAAAIRLLDGEPMQAAIQSHASVLATCILLIKRALVSACVRVCVVCLRVCRVRM